MKRIIFVFIIFIFVTGCASENKKEFVEKTNEINKDVSNVTPFINPAIIYGSDFLTFMQSLVKIGDNENLLKFTSKISVEKLGEENVLQYYKENFTNVSKLELKSIVDNPDGTKIMNYVNLSMATKSTLKVIVNIENDSCKLVIPISFL